MRAPFTNDEYNRLFAKEGYVVIKGLLNNDALDQLRLKDYSIFYHFRDNNFSSIDKPDTQQRDHYANMVKQALSPPLSNILLNYKAVVSSYLLKGIKEKTEFPLHQNPTFVDEREFSSIVCWIPLQDVNTASGALYVVPGSHRVFNTYRSANFTEEKYFEKIAAQVIAEFGVTIDMEAGDAIFFDDALLHGSYSNTTGNIRAAVAQVLIPEESKVVYCKKTAGKITLYQVPENFFELIAECTPDSLLDPSKVILQVEDNGEQEYSFGRFKTLYSQHRNKASEQG